MYAHVNFCNTGHGRTGILAALLLAELYPSMAANTCLDVVQEYHDHRVDSWGKWASPETEQQVAYCKMLIEKMRQ